MTLWFWSPGGAFPPGGGFPPGFGPVMSGPMVSSNPFLVSFTTRVKRIMIVIVMNILNNTSCSSSSRELVLRLTFHPEAPPPTRSYSRPISCRLHIALLQAQCQDLYFVSQCFPKRIHKTPDDIIMSSTRHPMTSSWAPQDTRWHHHELHETPDDIIMSSTRHPMTSSWAPHEPVTSRWRHHDLTVSLRYVSFLLFVLWRHFLFLWSPVPVQRSHEATEANKVKGQRPDPQSLHR